MSFNAGGDQFDDCARETEYECNVQYVRAVKRLITMEEYYKCYIDAYQACPSPLLKPLTRIYEGFVDHGSALYREEKKLAGIIAKIMTQAAKHQEL